MCLMCGRTVTGYEVAVTYSIDEYERPPVLMVPQHALPEWMKAPPPEPEEPEDPPELQDHDRRLLAE